MDDMKKSTKWNEKMTLNSVNWTIIANIFIIITVIGGIFGVVFAALNI